MCHGGAAPVCAACKVPINLFNAHAFIQCTVARVTTSTYDIPYTRVTASAPLSGGWLTVGQWKMNEHMLDIIKQPMSRMQKQDTLFTAFALALPRSFPGVVWDAKQHAEHAAQPDMLLDYEYVPYEQFLRRKAVLHVCEHWADFAPFVIVEHGPGITTAALYRNLMLLKYSSPGLFTEVLALCDIFESSSVVIVHYSGSTVYEVFPRKAAADAVSTVSLLYKDSYWHVLLPSRATDVQLPAVMSVPPAAWQAAADRMVYSRNTALGIVGWMEMLDGDVLPPVCLAMPPRPLQGQPLTADPEPWVGEPDLGLFSFGTSSSGGCSYYGLGPSWQHQVSSSGSSSDSTDDDADCLRETHRLHIPCQGGGQALARFMAAAYFTADNCCWQCGGLFAWLARGPFAGDTKCSCTSCKCKGCMAGALPLLTCPWAPSPRRTAEPDAQA